MGTSRRRWRSLRRSRRTVRGSSPCWWARSAGSRPGSFRPATSAITCCPAEPIYRRQWWKNIRWPMLAGHLLRGVDELLQAERPAAVLGTGGYASAPVVWRAARGGLPTAIQEQNAYPGPRHPLAQPAGAARVSGSARVAATAPIREPDAGVRHRQPDRAANARAAAARARSSSAWSPTLGCCW